jgi:hypothetical protein
MKEWRQHTTVWQLLRHRAVVLVALDASLHTGRWHAANFVAKLLKHARPALAPFG